MQVKIILIHSNCYCSLDVYVRVSEKTLWNDIDFNQSSTDDT